MWSKLFVKQNKPLLSLNWEYSISDIFVSNSNMCCEFERTRERKLLLTLQCVKFHIMIRSFKYLKKVLSSCKVFKTTQKYAETLAIRHCCINTFWYIFSILSQHSSCIKSRSYILALVHTLKTLHSCIRQKIASKSKSCLHSA